MRRRAPVAKTRRWSPEARTAVPLDGVVVSGLLVVGVVVVLDWGDSRVPKVLLRIPS